MEISEKVGFSPLRIFFPTAMRSAALKNHRFFGRFPPRSLLPKKIFVLQAAFLIFSKIS